MFWFCFGVCLIVVMYWLLIVLCCRLLWCWIGLVVELKFGDVAAFDCLIAVVGFAADVWL